MMRTALLPALLLAIATSSLAQTQPPKDPELPVIPKPWKGSTKTKPDLDKPEAAFDYTVTLRETKETVFGTLVTCQRLCKGGVHYSHAECDYKCDEKCTAKHLVDLQAKDAKNEDGFHELKLAMLETEGEQKYVSTQFLSDPETDMLNAAILQVRAVKQKHLKMNVLHWVTDACSSATREYGYRKYEVVAKWTFNAKGAAKTPAGESVLYTVWIPQQEPLKDPKPSPNCKCQIIVKLDEDGGGKQATGGKQETGVKSETGVKPETGTKEQFSPTPGWGFSPQWGPPKGFLQPKAPEDSPEGGIRDSKTGMFFDPKALEKCKFACVGQDMNVLNVNMENPTSMPLDIAIFPGTTFFPSNPGTQIMAAISTARLHLEPMGHAKICFSAGDAPAPDGAVQVRVMCLEMHKAEPAPDVKFQPGLLTDELALRAVRLASRERFRGAHTQVRIWLATDHATLAEINQRLAPSVTPGRYLECLYEDAQADAIDMSEPAIRACLDRGYLEAADASPAATAWAIGAMSEWDSPGLAAFLRSSAVIPHLFEGTADPQARKRGLALLEACTNSESEAIRLAGMDLLLATPADSRPALLKEGALLGLLALPEGMGAGETEKRLSVAEAWRYRPALAWAASVAQGGPTDALRAHGARAAEALKAVAP